VYLKKGAWWPQARRRRSSARPALTSGQGLLPPATQCRGQRRGWGRADTRYRLRTCAGGRADPERGGAAALSPRPATPGTRARRPRDLV